MLINKNCYHALALGEAEYAYCAAIPDFSLCGAHSFTLTIQFHPSDTGKKLVLFSQQDILEIGWEKGAFYYETKTAGRVSAEQWSMPLAENEWNQLDLTYKDGTLIFYLNGIRGCEKKIAAGKETGTQEYRIGTMFEGYIRYIRIANVCLEDGEIIKNQYQNQIETTKLELFFDFCSRKVKDLGRHNIPVLFSGLAEVKDIVRALYPGKSGAAVPVKTVSVNPGGFESGQYTFYHRVFLEYGQQTDTVVAANGDLTQGIVLMITVEHRMKLLWNGKEYCAENTLSTYEWLDLAVTYDGKKLKFYANGVLDTETEITDKPEPLAEGNIHIGNVIDKSGRTLSGQSFRGYIDCVAVFDRALSSETLLGYVEQAPYIYEDYLQALYQFHEAEPSECMTSGVITMTSGAALLFAENTLRVDEIGEIKYNPGKTKGEYTDFQIWEANTFVMAVAAFVEEQCGVKPSVDILGGEKLQGGALDYVVDSVAEEKAAQALLCAATAVTAVEVVTAMKALGESGKLFPLLKMLYNSVPAFFTGMLAETAKSELLSGAAVFTLGLTLLATVAATVTNQKTPEPPVPVPSPTPDPKRKYRFLQVKSMRFQYSENPKESAIVLAKSGKEFVAVPEWVSGVNSSTANPSLAAYIKSQLQCVKITVKFYYETNAQDSVTLKVSANEMGSAVLGAVPSFDLNVSGSGEYTKTITLSNQGMGKLSEGKYESSYSWNCTSLGFLGKSYHRTYLLPDTPVGPWSISKGEIKNAVTVGALEFFNQVMSEKKSVRDSGEGNALADACDVAIRTLHYLLDSGRFRYPEDAEPQYSCFNDDEDTVIFDKDRFDTAVNGSGNIAVNCLDCSAVIVGNCALGGHTLSIMDMIAEGATNIIIIDGERIETPPLLAFEKTLLIGEREWKELEDIDTHYVAAQGDKTNLSAMVYDGCLIGCGQGDKKVYAEGIYFTKTDSRVAAERDVTCYRETWIKEGNSCNIDRAYRMQFGEVTPESGEDASEVHVPMVNSVFAENNILYIRTDYRYGFDPVINRNLPVQNGQNRCHSISYSSICEAVASPLNAYMQGTLSAAQIQQYLDGLRQIVFINNRGNGVDRAFYQGAVQTVQNITALLNQNPPASFTNNRNLWTRLTNYANTLISQMNNSRNNLRVGDAAWNQSIGEAFDPVGWCYVDSALRIVSDETTLQYAQPPARPAIIPPFVGRGFYLTEPDDGLRMHGMENLVYGNAGFGVYKAREMGTNSRFLYSSSNQFLIPGCVGTTERLYYLHNNVWTAF